MMTRLLLVVGACVLTFGYSKCVFVSGDGGGGGHAGDGRGGFGNDFSTTLVLLDSTGTATTRFVMGEPIRFDLEIENLAGRAATLQFPDAQIYELYVFDAADDRLRWRWSEGMVFAQVSTQLAFAPRSTHSATVTWDGVLADGTQLPAGQYRARGVIVAEDFSGDPLDPGELGSELVDFTVR
jgi:hypothetical protein